MENTIRKLIKNIRIFRAVKTNLFTQGFGRVNTNPALLPLYESYGLLGHEGNDFGVKCKDNKCKTGGQCENIYCDIDGYATITYIAKDVKTGFGIVAQDQDPNFKHTWWHFDSINHDLKMGDKIEDGVLLGVAGNTGMSTGAHLHRGVSNYLFQDNGYHGALDPQQWFTNVFILDQINNVKQSINILETLKSKFPIFQIVIDALKKVLAR